MSMILYELHCMREGGKYVLSGLGRSPLLSHTWHNVETIGGTRDRVGY